MDTLTGLLVIGLCTLFVWGITALIEQHRADSNIDEGTDFDQYDIPCDDFTLRDADDIPDLVLEGLTFHGVCRAEIGPLRDFAADKVGWYYGDIIRAFYRAQLGIKD